jgi:hypothetical protein
LSTSDGEKQPLNRRQLITGLAALGIAGAATVEATAQAKTNIPDLQGASEILGEHFSPERLQIIATALQRNLEQFENLRLFEVPDSIEPAPVFLPLRYYEHPPVERNIGMVEGTKEDAHG